MPSPAISPLFDSDGDNSAQAARATEGRLFYVHVVNPNAADAYIQFFDVAAGSVTVGVTVPTLSFLVPAGNGTDAGAFDQWFGDRGIQFNTAITYACTTTATGSTDPTTGLTVNIGHGGSG